MCVPAMSGTPPTVIGTDELYDYAVRRLFKERLHKHDGYNICFAIRGNSHRTAAFRQALEQARDRFAREREV